MVDIGGYVYRGKAMPEMVGRYIFGDWGTNYTKPDGTLLLISPSLSDSNAWQMQVIQIAASANGQMNEFIRGFGEDSDHELYVVTSRQAGPNGTTGKVYKIVPA